MTLNFEFLEKVNFLANYNEQSLAVHILTRMFVSVLPSLHTRHYVFKTSCWPIQTSCWREFSKVDHLSINKFILMEDIVLDYKKGRPHTLWTFWATLCIAVFKFVINIALFSMHNILSLAPMQISTSSSATWLYTQQELEEKDELMNKSIDESQRCL